MRRKSPDLDRRGGGPNRGDQAGPWPPRHVEIEAERDEVVTDTARIRMFGDQSDQLSPRRRGARGVWAGSPLDEEGYQAIVENGRWIRESPTERHTIRTRPMPGCDGSKAHPTSSYS